MTTNILTTDQLVLRSAIESDLDALYYTVFSDPKVMCHAFEGKVLSKKESKNFFTNSFDFDGCGKKIGALAIKGTATPIGFAGLLPCVALGERDYEIGFVLGQKFWGQGLATEIGHAQIKYGLNTLGCKRLLALVAPQNKASVSILKKIGMAYHATIETKNRGAREIYVTHRTHNK
jgi:RimJ/RimL family protein N-acetyltransferase